MPQGRLAAFLLAMALAAPVAGAQDSVIVIDPDAPPVDSLPSAGLLPELVREVVARFNDSSTVRLSGEVFLPAGARLAGPLGVYRGVLRIAGTVEGPVTVVNGNLVVLPGGVLRGDVLVVGGRFVVGAEGLHEGTARVYWDAAPVVRTAEGALTLRERRRSLGQLTTAQRSFQVGRVRTTLRLASTGTYNRVEGLPVQVGPAFELRPSERSVLRLDLRGIVRTSDDRSGLRGDLGYRATAEWRRLGGSGLRLGITARSVVEPIAEEALSLDESGWSSFLLQRDYRDYYDVDGVGAFVGFSPSASLRVELGVRRDDERSVRANDPWSLFRNSDRWRPNPLVDDGDYTAWTLALAYDTRNDRSLPTSGWYVRVAGERGSSDDLSPVELPTAIRAPLPTDGSYAFHRLWVDARRYTRLTPGTQVNFRLVGGGWVSGDPLPVQRRLALGGPDLLPGYGFRATTCSGALDPDPTDAGLCDRLIAAQLEFRSRLRLGWSLGLRDRELDRLINVEEADLVVFADAGDAWLAGDGPGRVPTNRIPVLEEWKADVGVGLDLGGAGVYLAKALTDGQPVRVVLRLQRRF